MISEGMPSKAYKITPDKEYKGEGQMFRANLNAKPVYVIS